MCHSKQKMVVFLCFIFAVTFHNSAAQNATNSTVSTNFSTTANLTTTPGITVPATTPTTLSPLSLKKIWCRLNYTSWSAPVVQGCSDPFHSTCSEDIVNATNGFLVCKELLSAIPTSKVIPPMLLAGRISDLGMQFSAYYASKRTITAEEEKYRLLRIHKSKMLFEAGVAYKYSGRTWPDYNQKTRFPTHKWNGRNDTIYLPYATIPSGVFQYSFNMYDNLHDAAISKDAVRLKDSWRTGNLITDGVFIDYQVEKGLTYNPNHVINSAVISLSLFPIPKSPVSADLIITFWHKKKGLFKPVCVYWQYVKPTDASLRHQTGYWTNYGMTIVKTNDTTTVCAASHIEISSFAVLMEPYYEEPPEPADPFTLATILLTVASIIILIAYVVAMFLLGCTRTKYSRMYIFIAISCMLSQIVFVYGLTKKKDWDQCTTLSIIMQLCHTTVMSWMMLESVHQLSRIRYFFNEEKSNIDALYFVIGWGFPIAVIIALIGYPFEKFTEVRYCWVYVRGFEMWFFAGPLVALFLISAILRLITFYEIRKHREKLTRDINYQRAWRSLIASVFFLPLIAVLWYVATTGVTLPKSESGVFLICVPSFNAFVGVLIFIFYFYKNDEVHDALIEQRKIKERKRLLKYEHLKGMKMKVKYRPDISHLYT